MGTNVGLLVDIDGLLLNTEIHKWIAYDQTLNDISKGEHSLGDQAYKEEFVGNTSRKICEAIIDHFNLDVSIEKFMEKKNEILSNFIEKGKFEKMPYMDEFLEYAKGFSTTLITDTTYYEACMNEVRLDLVLTTNGFQFVGKDAEEIVNGNPTPNIYSIASKRINRDPDKCYAFDDSAPGVESALDAGVGKVFAVPNNWTNLGKFPSESIICKDLNDALQKTKDYIQHNLS